MATSVTLNERSCLGRRDCITVCPEEVFGWRRATGVGFGIQLKLLLESRGYQAYVANEQACTACMACVMSCPEGAIEVTVT